MYRSSHNLTQPLLCTSERHDGIQVISFKQQQHQAPKNSCRLPSMDLDDIKYSRETAISAVTDFYRFLTRMYPNESHVIYPLTSSAWFRAGTRRWCWTRSSELSTGRTGPMNSTGGTTLAGLASTGTGTTRCHPRRTTGATTRPPERSPTSSRSSRTSSSSSNRFPSATTRCDSTWTTAGCTRRA